MIIGSIGLVTAVVVAVTKYKESKRRISYGLKKNPDRCREHADRIQALEDYQKKVLHGLGENKAATEAVGKNVDLLLKIHMKDG